MSDFDSEVLAGERFQFGKNWNNFLKVIDDKRINQATDALLSMLQLNDLEGKSFVDIGSGSGLMSLAARRAGARVFSFDYDPQSVSCTKELKRRYFTEDEQWVIESGSVLDNKFIGSLGQFDVVYSWGVLHHTGDMWRALENVIPLIADDGKLFIAIYNDQSGQSRRWLKIKKFYNKLPVFLKMPYAVIIMAPREIKYFIMYLLKGRPVDYFRTIVNYSDKSERGMSYWHDLVDWLGGYPFEVAKPEVIFEFYRKRGFELQALKTCGGGIGCNEYVFVRKSK